MVLLAQSETPSEASVEFPPVPSHVALAWHDLSAGLIRYWMWWTLAFQDIKLRYRGSTLGPFWLTLSMLFLSVGMGVIYSHLFHTDAQTYMPYLTMGLIIWQYINTLTGEACQTFMMSESVIQQVPIPFSIHAYRVVCRNMVVLGHNLLIVPIGLVVFHIHLGWNIIEIVPAVLLLAINGIWTCMLLGMLSSRFRDIAPIVGSIMQISFFMTPVIWPADALGIYHWLADINPLFAAIDVLRAPVLGVAPARWSWPVLIVFTILGSGAAFALFARFRSRIAYWV